MPNSLDSAVLLLYSESLRLGGPWHLLHYMMGYMIALIWHIFITLHEMQYGHN